MKLYSNKLKNRYFVCSSGLGLNNFKLPHIKLFFSFLFILMIFLSNGYAGSVRLTNDSPYKLRAVIRAADGTILGELVIGAQNNATWNDSYSHLGQFGKGNLADEQVTQSQTPYDVLWYCMDGGDYSFCYQVSTGATVTAQSCSGARMCQPQKKESGPFPNQPEGQALYQPPKNCVPCCPTCPQQEAPQTKGESP